MGRSVYPLVGRLVDDLLNSELIYQSITYFLIYSLTHLVIQSINTFSFVHIVILSVAPYLMFLCLLIRLPVQVLISCGKD